MEQQHIKKIMTERYLNKINSPADLKKLPPESLPVLAQEIRETLIAAVSQTGGHLASNLGVVELTIALHRCFDSPRDQLVWDVGHQVYTHKLLTGRQDRFATLRCEEGLSGFSCPRESEHDVFFTGHAGTSVSSALGLASAKEIREAAGYTVAIVGDGSFTGGLIYEALNNASRVKDNFIVVLNENEMSISENVGSVARYLAALRTKPEYYLLKDRTEQVLRRVPLLGAGMASGVHKTKAALKNMLYRSTWFEELGFRYLGPIDGHDIARLCEAFDSAKIIKQPVFIHINTVKGKGYDFAERAPEQFHGISKFDVVSGEPLPSGETYSERFGSKLCELARRDERICAITAAMSLGTGLEGFAKQFEVRFFDVGIAEEHAVTFALGLAKNGTVPVFAVYATFLQRCYDQLLHDGALQKQKIILAVDRAGFVGGDGETHQGLYDVALMNGIPHVEIYAPARFAELEAMLECAVYGEHQVVAIRYPRGGERPLPEDFKFSAADFNLYGDPAAGTAIVTYGRVTAAAAAALNRLKAEGLSLLLIKLNCIKPIDDGAVQAALHCKQIYFFEEGTKNGGIGDKFARLLLEAGYRGGYRLTAVDDCFVRQAEAEALLRQYHLDEDGIVETILGRPGV